MHYLACSNVYNEVWQIKKLIKERQDISLKIAEVLVKGGVDINGVDEDGMTPLMYAMKNVRYSFVTLFSKGPKTRAVDQ